MAHDETINALKHELAGVFSTDSSKIFPTILAEVTDNALNQQSKLRTRVEDLALTYFHEMGLCCDRTRQNLYGYPGLFRDLNSPPPWIEEVTMDESDGHISEVRKRELQPLHWWVDQYDNDELYGLYRHYRERLAEQAEASGDLKSARILHTMNGAILDIFTETVELARCLGAESFPELFDCVLDPDEHLVTATGAPDLFVWSQQHDLWFFAEIKGQGDSLRSSQIAWLNANWNTIGGRFVLVALHEHGATGT